MKPPPRMRDIYGAQRDAMTPLKLAGQRGIIWRGCKKVAAPQLQKKMGGDPKVSHYFNECFWVTTPPQLEHAVMPSLSSEHWRKLAHGWWQDKRAAEPRKETKTWHRDGFAHNPFDILKKAKVGK